MSVWKQKQKQIQMLFKQKDMGVQYHLNEKKIQVSDKWMTVQLQAMLLWNAIAFFFTCMRYVSGSSFVI